MTKLIRDSYYNISSPGGRWHIWYIRARQYNEAFHPQWILQKPNQEHEPKADSPCKMRVPSRPLLSQPRLHPNLISAHDFSRNAAWNTFPSPALSQTPISTFRSRSSTK